MDCQKRRPEHQRDISPEAVPSAREGSMASMSWRTSHRRDPILGDRYDVEYGQPLHSFRMVESEAIGDAPATVVSDEIEPGESKFIHDRNEFVRHRSLRIGVVILCGGWHAAAPIAPEIHTNHGVAVRKARCHVTPHQAGPRKAVHHEQRRSFSISSYENGVVAGLDFRRLEVTRIGRCCSAGGLSGDILRCKCRRQSGAGCRGHCA
jgi:hypothetical protein